MKSYRFFAAFLAAAIIAVLCGLPVRVIASPITGVRTLVYYDKTTTVEGVAYPVPITSDQVTAYRWVYRLGAANVLLPGDLVEGCWKHEFTNDSGINVETVTSMTIMNGGGYYDSDLTAGHATPTEGAFMSPPSGTNINPQRHHEVLSECASYVIPATTTLSTYADFLVRVRARSTDYASAATGLTVMPSGYGYFYIKVWR